MNTYKRSPILRGDILYAELGAAVGSEQAGFRPVVVVQNDVGNRYSPTVVVAPLTSNIRKNILPTHVHVGRESGVRPLWFCWNSCGRSISADWEIRSAT